MLLSVPRRTPLCSSDVFLVVSYCFGDTFVFVPCCFRFYDKYPLICPPNFISLILPRPLRFFLESRIPLLCALYLLDLLNNHLFVFFDFLNGDYYFICIILAISMPVLCLSPCPVFIWSPSGFLATVPSCWGVEVACIECRPFLTEFVYHILYKQYINSIYKLEVYKPCCLQHQRNLLRL
jgi:hypothetical protein